MFKTGRSFYKLSGSGNDFVFVDSRSEPPGRLQEPEVIHAVCARGTGVGADGVVFIGPHAAATFAIRYLNSDGSVAALCGNATLCAARLGVEMGLAPNDREFTIATDSGILKARLRNGLPEIDLQPITEIQESFPAVLRPSEQGIGYATVGVPHVVILCDEVQNAPVLERGRQLRHDHRLPHGANVNFVAAAAGGWRIRTYERGVENETLACGTGAVATGLLLSRWGRARPEGVELLTRSGRVLRVRYRTEADGVFASLSGEANIVFVGRLAELPS